MDVPDDIEAKARELARLYGTFENRVAAYAAALMAERERWKPAVTYFERYCQDEAEDDGVNFTGCSEQQHADAVAFRAAIRRGTA